ncbi:MarR family winged helix-turn-helix transcriptional regulator [Sulfitobacter guttiformis]|uniref:DNA-binding MarR family transcriptional regulator n=1 Tax=Sulfitobacter guttiformis TaxID=74349 RepID=A0A420DTD9_9RHOB|nr:MarR family transcriptional regulator [Sulfitobacter guttiformis]KIN71111.1 putative transcription regulator protein [Sulfitobacter guttiformis KCTC 32187]RKE97594.1 DNA-binding MarR family transcriptional regulator [Sulfitobacter guttiformis]
MDPKIDTDSPGFLISTTARLMRAAFEREIELSMIGVTAGEARVLAHMSVCGALRQHHLAERLGVTAMSVTVFLDKLENSGLIERNPDPDDRRAKIVTLTEAAGPVIEQIQLAGKRAKGVAFEGVDSEAFEVFKSVCHKLCDNLNTQSCDQGDAK